jgi:antitoxin VapB
MIHLSRETEALAQQLAAAHRLTAEEMIHIVLEQRARAEGLVVETPSRDRSAEAVAARRSRTEALVAKFAAMPVLDPRSPREIMDDLDPL